MPKGLSGSRPRGLAGPVYAYVRGDDGVALDQDEAALRASILEGRTEALDDVDDRNALTSRLLKVAVHGLARAEAEARLALEEAVERRSLIRRNNEAIRRSQQETRAMIEQLVNG